MKILIGTTNPAKVRHFEKLLDGYDIEFCTLKDLLITSEPEEVGKTPEENAVIKAKYYGKFFDIVICSDSGLYFDCLPLNDIRQPGLNVRRPKGLERLNDDQMISYYSDLICSLGGKVMAYYKDGIAVNYKGHISSFMESSESAKNNAFYMTDKPANVLRPGWPLDSLSISINSYDEDITERENSRTEYWNRITQFLIRALGLSN